MHKDDQFYTFVLSHSTKNQIRIRRIEVSRRWLQSCAGVAIMSLGAVTYSFYGIVKQAANVQIAQTQESKSLRIKNELAKQELAYLTTRIEAVAKLPQSTITAQNDSTDKIRKGEGGPIEPNLTSNLPESNGLPSNSDKNQTSIEATLRTAENTPSIYPIVGKINDEFGWRNNPFGGVSYEKHPGLDIDGEKGDPVSAPASGTVLRAEWSNGYGNLLEIDHGGGLITRYGHLSQIEVKRGDTVTRGQFIAKVGSTGRSTGPHLHYEVRINNQPVNPHLYLPQLPAEIVQQTAVIKK